MGPDAARRHRRASDLSAAIERQAELIGWTAATVIHLDTASEAIGALDHADAVLVIDHHPFVATPSLAAALQRGIGYVGVLDRTALLDVEPYADPLLVPAGHRIEPALRSGWFDDADLSGPHTPRSLGA